MTYTFSNLLQDIFSSLGQWEVSLATGGTTTTLVDSGLAGKWKDDAWAGGALFILRDSGGAGAAPEGEFKRLSSYTGRTGTFTMENALSSAAAVDDTYAVTPQTYPLHNVIQLANEGLRALGDVGLNDCSTLATAGGQSEYPTSLAWQRGRPLRVDFQTVTGTANDHGWQRVLDWEYAPSSPGQSGQIVIYRAIPAGRALRIWYVGSHPRLNDHDGLVSETIMPELAVLAGVEKALRWQNGRMNGADRPLFERWEAVRIELAKAKARYPIWQPGRVSRLMGIGGRA